MKDYEAGENPGGGRSASPGHPASSPSLTSLTWLCLLTRTSLLQSQLLLTSPALPTSLSSFPAGQLYGLEKFWAFLKYSKAKNLDIDPKLQEYLGKFRRLEDFRVDVSTSLLLTLVVLERKLDPRSGNLGSGSNCTTSPGTPPVPTGASFLPL